MGSAMRYEPVAKIEGQLYWTESASIYRGGLLFEFHIDDKGQAVEVAVNMAVPPKRVERFASEIGPGQGSSVATYNIGGDRELYDYLVSELQSLESALAFESGAVKRIRWDAPEQRFIPENPQEEELLAVTRFFVSHVYPESRALLQTDALISLVATYPQHDSLRVSQAFWREGRNYFECFEYVHAIYQFYFIIEDFYAGGKSGKAAVLKEFANSQEFEQLAQRSLKALFRQPRHRQALEKLFVQEKCEISGTGLQKLIFEVRGSLHHFSSNSPKTRGMPFNQKESESIALLMMHLTAVAIGHRIAANNLQSEKGPSQQGDNRVLDAETRNPLPPRCCDRK